MSSSFVCLQPLAPEDFTKLEFVNATSGTNVPRQHVNAIEKVRHIV